MAVVADSYHDDAGPDEEVIEGRPDFRNPKFGVTRAKRFPPYVFSVSVNSCLIHKIAYVEMHWYEVIRGGHALARRRKPFVFATTVCGQSKRLSVGSRGAQPARTCLLPDPDAVLCGRCHGEAATFGKEGAGTKAGLSRQEAWTKLGCVVKGY